LILESWSDAFDVEGSPTSGSVRQENLNDDGIKAGGIGQCVPITAGESYRFGGSTYKPSGQSAAGRAGILFHWKSSTDCTGPDVGGYFGTDGSAADFDEWYPFTSDFSVAPAGAHTAQLDLVSRKDDATGTFVAYWDGLFVVPEPATMLLQSAALGALVALARRRCC